MRPTTLTVGPISGAVANNIALSQTPSAAFTLNGSTVTSGVATLDTPRRVLFTQAASEAGKTYTIVGTTWGGTPQTEVLSAASAATTVYTALDFLTITSIRISSAAAGAITVGTNGNASSRWMRLDSWALPTCAIQCDVSGTVNYSVQTCMQDPNTTVSPVLPYSMTWMDSPDPIVVGATADQVSYFTAAPLWVRIFMNSGDGSVSAVIMQHGVNPA